MKTNSPLSVPGLGHPGISFVAVGLAMVALTTGLRADVPRPVIQTSPPGPESALSLRWDATVGSGYRVLASTNLGEGTWAPVDYLVASSNSLTWQTNGPASSSQFFRLATEAISIQNIEPAIVGTGAVTTVYITGQGFGPDDVVRLLGPGGPLVLTNRLILSPTLISVTVGPSFTPDVPGTYQLEITNASTGQTATSSYRWTVLSAPAGSRALLAPPQEPPSSPAFKKGLNAVNVKLAFAEEPPSPAKLKEFTDHISLLKLTDESQSLLRVRNLGSSGQDGVDVAGYARGNKTGHVTLNRAFDDGEVESSFRKFYTGNLGSSGQDGASVANLGSSGQDGVEIKLPTKKGSAMTAGGGGAGGLQLASGEVQLQSVDLLVPGRSLDFAWTLTYRSRSAARPGMCPGWTHSYDVSVASTSEGVAVSDGTGRMDVYYLGTNGVYSCPEFFNEGQLTKGVFTLTFPDTGKWVFNPLDTSPAAGKLSQIVCRTGDSISLTYDSTGKLSQIVDDLGRACQVGYNAAGQLASLTDFSGRTVSYQYYASGEVGGSPGDLKSVTSPPVTGTPNGNDFPNGKTTTFTYSSGFPIAEDRQNHLLLSVMNGNGDVLRRYTYQHNQTDLGFLRCVAIQEGTHTPSQFTYLPVTASPSNNYRTLTVCCTDSLGNVSECSYDSRNRLVDLREFTGRATPGLPTTATLNRPVNKLRAGDPDCYETQWVWNNDSLCVQEIEPQGSLITCAYERDFYPNASPRKKGDLRAIRLVDVSGGGLPDLVRRFDYDPRFGSPQSPGAAFHAINTKGTGGKNGRLLPTVNKRVSSGQPAITENIKGLQVDFCVSVTDPRGHGTVASYGPQGNCVLVAHQGYLLDGSDSPVTGFAYNPHGQLTAITNALDGNGHRRVDTYEYYSQGPQNGLLYKWTVDTQGPIVTLATTYEYDARGNLTRCVDPRTNDWLYAYNALDQMVQSSSPLLSDGTPKGNSYRINTQFAYDAANNLTRCAVENRSPSGALDSASPQWITAYQYDSLRRCVQIQQRCDASHDVVTQYQYDGNNNLVLARCGEAVNGHSTNNVVQYQYDERNLLFRCVSAPGTSLASPVQWDYDANKQVTTKQYVDTGLSAQVRCLYDGFGRCVSVTDAMGTSRTNRYDGNGNVLDRRVYDKTYPRLSDTVCVYDALDRCVQQTDLLFDPITQAPLGSGARITAFVRSPNGDCLSVTDANHHTTHYSYDALGRRTAIIDAKDCVVACAYDACGNLTSVTQTDRSDLGGADAVFVTTAQFDALNRCIRCVDNLGNTELASYDSRGNIVTQVDARGNLTGRTFDGLNRCVTMITDLDGNGVLDPAADAASAIAYDDDDCVIQTTDANKNSTFYAFDALDRCVLTTCPDGTTCSVTYDARGNLLRTFDPTGNVVKYTYDLNQRCVRKDISPGIQAELTTLFEVFSYDACSRLTLASNDVSVLTYSYDSLGDCTVSTQDGLAITRTFDAVGNCLSMTYPGGRVVQYSYDGSDQVASVASGAGQGLPVSPLATYSYDGPNHLASVTRPNQVNTRVKWDGSLNSPNATGDLGWRQVAGVSHSFSAKGVTQILERRGFVYDANQNKTQSIQTSSQLPTTNIWAYNSLNMLYHAVKTKGTGGNLGFTDYSLDAKGNRLAVTRDGVSGKYTRNSKIPPGDFQMDRYTTTPVSDNLYSGNGDLWQASNSAGQTLYGYDYADRLVYVYSLTTGQATPVATFTYDALGHRLSKTSYADATSPPVTTYYVRSGKEDDQDCDDCVIETRLGDATGPVIHATCQCGHLRLGRPAINTALACFSGAGALEYYFLNDDLGNVLALAGPGGDILERYDYDDFGAPQFLTSDGLPSGATASLYGNPILFHAMEWDDENHLYSDGGSSGENPLYEAPEMGRTVTPRTGQCGSGACSAYAFADNNPWTAPSNREKLKATTKTQGDFNLSNRFSFEIEGISARKSVSVIFHNDAGEESLMVASGGHKKDYVGHVTLMK